MRMFRNLKNKTVNIDGKKNAPSIPFLTYSTNQLIAVDARLTVKQNKVDDHSKVAVTLSFHIFNDIISRIISKAEFPGALFHKSRW